MVKFIKEIIQNYSRTDSLVQYLNDIIKVLVHTLFDKHSESKNMLLRIYFSYIEMSSDTFSYAVRKVNKTIKSFCDGSEMYRELSIDLLLCLIYRLILDDSYLMILLL